MASVFDAVGLLALRVEAAEKVCGVSGRGSDDPGASPAWAFVAPSAAAAAKANLAQSLVTLRQKRDRVSWLVDAFGFEGSPDSVDAAIAAAAPRRPKREAVVQLEEALTALGAHQAAFDPSALTAAALCVTSDAHHGAHATPPPSSAEDGEAPDRTPGAPPHIDPAALEAPVRNVERGLRLLERMAELQRRNETFAAATRERLRRIDRTIALREALLK